MVEAMLKIHLSATELPWAVRRQLERRGTQRKEVQGYFQGVEYSWVCSYPPRFACATICADPILAPLLLQCLQLLADSQPWSQV